VTADDFLIPLKADYKGGSSSIWTIVGSVLILFLR